MNPSKKLSKIISAYLIINKILGNDLSSYEILQSLIW